MILQPKQNSYTTFMGWYGSCEQDCESYDLTTEPKIFSVYQFSEDGTGVSTYLQNSAPFLQSFTTLECGKAYWIILYPDESSQSSVVNIPHFVGSNNTNNEFGYVTNNCTQLSTPPPPNPQPTPTPTPEKTNFTSSPNGWFKYEILNTSGDTEYNKSKYKQVFHDAFNRWDEVITSAPTGWNLSVTVDFQVMEDNILGGAFPTMIARTGSDFFFGQTFVTDGQFMLNTKNMSSMYNNITEDGKSEMYYVSLHEIGHIIGIGYVTFMGEMVLQKPIVSYTDTADNTTKSYYTGSNATREYKNYFPQFANGIVGVPVEDDGGTGTAMAHPEEGLMGVVSRNDRFINGNFHPGLETELMSGWSDADTGKSLPMSKITIGFLQDMGFGVDYSKADNYDITNFAPPEAPIDGVPNFEPTPTPLSSSKKKILALHGGGGSPDGLRNQQGVISLMQSLHDCEFVFADAPNNLWIQDPPGGKDNPTTDPNWANDSIEYLDNLVAEHGPFFGILGYSQGAAFIPVYLANSSNTFDVALMYNGYLPYTHQGLMNIINSVAPFDIPSVVFSGEYDTGFKDMAPDLASKFSNSLYVRSSSAGHHLPFSNDPTYNEILSYINAVELTVDQTNDDPCSGFGVTWGDGIGPSPEGCNQ